MKRTKRTKVKARPEYQEPQRFIDFVGASDFYSRFRRLVAALELLAVEPPSEDIGCAGVIDWLAELGERMQKDFSVVLHNTVTLGPDGHAHKVLSRVELQVIRDREKQTSR